MQSFRVEDLYVTGAGENQPSLAQFAEDASHGRSRRPDRFRQRLLGQVDNEPLVILYGGQVQKVAGHTLPEGAEGIVRNGVIRLCQPLGELLREEPAHRGIGLPEAAKTPGIENEQLPVGHHLNAGGDRPAHDDGDSHELP